MFYGSKDGIESEMEVEKNGRGAMDDVCKKNQNCKQIKEFQKQLQIFIYFLPEGYKFLKLFPPLLSMNLTFILQLVRGKICSCNFWETCNLGWIIFYFVFFRNWVRKNIGIITVSIILMWINSALRRFAHRSSKYDAKLFCGEKAYRILLFIAIIKRSDNAFQLCGMPEILTSIHNRFKPVYNWLK